MVALAIAGPGVGLGAPSASSGPSLRSIRSAAAAAGIAEAVTKSGESLQNIVNKFVNTTITPAIEELDRRISQINLEIEGIKEEDKKVSLAALEDMLNARKELDVIRVSLEALATDSIDTSNRLIRLLQKITPDYDESRIRKLVGYTAGVLSGLMGRSAELLADAKVRLLNIQGRMSKIEAQLKYLHNKLTSILQSGSKENDEWIKKNREIVYGSCAATILAGPAVVVCYATAAAILETKIAKLKKALKERKTAINNALDNINPLITQLDSLDTDVAKELGVIILWKQKVKVMQDDFKDVDSIVDLIDFEGKDTAIDMLEGLKEVCQKYLDLGSGKKNKKS